MRRNLLTILSFILVVSACGVGDDTGTDLDEASDASATSADEDTHDRSDDTDALDDDASSDAPLVVGVQFDPQAGWAIESNDAFVLTTIGVTETLVRIDTRGDAQPSLATGWEQLDERTWRFDLRDDVVFHDGATMDATAAADALNWLFASATPPRGLAGDVVTAEVLDPTSLVVTTDEPDPILPLRLSVPNAAILAPSAYESDPPDPFGTGTGPFVLTPDAPAETASLVAHADHWKGAPDIEEIIVRFITDPESRATALRTGELDVALGIPVTQLETLADEPGLSIESVPSPRTTALYPNASRPPFDDPQVRDALAAAIDQRALAEGLLEGTVPPAAGIFSPSDPWALAPDPSAADPEAARALLDAAGLDDEALSVEIWTYPTRVELPSIATALQAMLNEAGFSAEVVVSEYGVLEPDVLDGNFDLFVLSRGYLVDVNDPAGFLESDFGCDGSYNLSHTCDEGVDTALTDLRQIADPAERNEHVRDIETRLLERAAVVPLVHDEVRLGVRDGVSGLDLDPLGHYLLTNEVRVQR